MTPLLLALPLIAAAPVPKDFKPPKSDAEALIGVWEYAEASLDGQPDAASLGIRYQFEAGGKCVLLYKDGSKSGVVSCVLDPTAQPKRYQWKAPWGTYNGSYELKGDRFVMALASGSNAPPPALAPGKGVVYSVLVRAKE